MTKRNANTDHLIGAKYGKLTVLAVKGIESQCKCECGTIKWVRSGNMYSGKTKSCGCGMRGPRTFKDVAEVVDKFDAAENATDATPSSRIPRMVVVNPLGKTMPMQTYLSGTLGYSAGAMTMAKRILSEHHRADVVDLVKAKAVVSLVELFFPRPVKELDTSPSS